MTGRLSVLAMIILIALSGGAMASCPVPAEAARMQQEVFRSINAERHARRLPNLAVSPQLQRIAERHACDMAVNGVRSHTGTGGATFQRRYVQGGGCGPGGENIAWMLRSPGEAVAGWMNSPPHRANILMRDAPQIGIAVSLSGRTLNWVMVVGRGC